MNKLTILGFALAIASAPLAAVALPTPAPGAHGAMHDAMGHHDAMKHDAMKHDAMAHHDAMKHDAMAHDAMKHDAMKHDSMAKPTPKP